MRICSLCEEEILDQCGYNVEVVPSGSVETFCTLAHLAEWAGVKNLEMQASLADDEVDLT